ncbi:MAG: glycosyltransferase [Candidatus Heimdallarchaeota archaeon]|nr:glycosyltransferase [Candidatus Heimdallarchaeota archaeon]
MNYVQNDDRVSLPLITALYLISLLFFLVIIWKYLRLSLDFVQLIFIVIFLVIDFSILIIIPYLQYLIFLNFKYHEPQQLILRNYPKVSIIIPFRDLPIVEFRLMLEEIQKIQYPKEILEVLAIGKTSEKENFESTADQFGVNLCIQNISEGGYKSRALNNILNKAGGEYCIILDSYHLVKPYMVLDFLISFAQLDNSVAYIQAGVDYYEVDKIIRRFSSVLRSQLYFFYIRARSVIGNAQFNGSTCCFKTGILREIGGFPEYSYTENSATSILFQKKGYQGYFLNKSLSSCKTRQNLTETVSQLYRWGHGLGSVVNHETKEIIYSSKLNVIRKYDMIMYHLVNSPAAYLILILPTIFSIISIFQITIPFLYFHQFTISLLIGYFLIISILTILNEDSRYSKFQRVRHNIVMFFLSLAFPVYVHQAFAKGKRNRDGPDSENSSWAFVINIKKYNYLISALIGLEIMAIIINFNWFNSLILVFFCIGQLLTIFSDR